MSELKAFTFGLGQYTEDGSPCVVAFDGEKNPRLASDEKFYLKSEADKVIAELKNEADVYKAKYEQEYDIAVHNEKQLSAMRIELRHHKYKRCLAMAETCQARYDEADVRVNGRGASWDFTSNEMKFWERWHNRWMELADEFKEGK